jgi:hypothetical protein
MKKPGHFFVVAKEAMPWILIDLNDPHGMWYWSTACPAW